MHWNESKRLVEQKQQQQRKKKKKTKEKDSTVKAKYREERRNPQVKSYEKQSVRSKI